MQTTEAQHHCESCRIRAIADRKPQSLIARFWRWHTGWCPGWKSYQRWLAEKALVSANLYAASNIGEHI